MTQKSSEDIDGPGPFLMASGAAVPMRPGLHYGVPRLDEPAPGFTARTTQGVCSLGDFAGSWLLLFAHPADFTPVCTSEFVALARATGEFDARNCKLLGLSVDSVFAHLAWIRSIKESFDVDVDFPIVEDVSMAIAAAYGMIHPGSTSTATVRSVFFIDPQGVLRAVQHYPLTVGRSVSELLRVLAALQATDGTDFATPEGWEEGDDMVLAPPLTVAEAQRRDKDPKAANWYFTQAGS